MNERYVVTYSVGRPLFHDFYSYDSAVKFARELSATGRTVSVYISYQVLSSDIGAAWPASMWKVIEEGKWNGETFVWPEKSDAPEGSK